MSLSNKELRRIRFLEEDDAMFGLTSSEHSELKDLKKQAGEKLK